MKPSIAIAESFRLSGERHSVSIVRLYKNGDTWVESTRFGRDDLPLVAKVSDLAHSWIYQQAQIERSDQPND